MNFEESSIPNARGGAEHFKFYFMEQHLESQNFPR